MAATIATPNAIALITKYSTEGFDKVYKKESIASVLAKDSSLVRFTGAKTVKVAKVAMGGLSDYYRNNSGDPRVKFGPGNPTSPTDYGNADAPYYGAGYRETPAGVTWEERTLRRDRAAKIVIEKFDDEESGGLLVGNILTEFNRTQIVPESDAYCFSEIYANAGVVKAGNIGISVGGSTVPAPLKALNEAFTYLGKREVPEGNQLIFLSDDYLNALRNSQEVTKFLLQGDFDKNVSFRLTKYEGRDLIVVPPARFQTEFLFGERGYQLTANSKAIDFIVMDKDAAVHVIKFQQTKILSGNEALIASNMDGFVLYARIYEDLIVLDNKRVGIYAHTDWFTDQSASGGLNLSADAVSVPGSNLAPVVGVYVSTASGDGVVNKIISIPGDKYLTIGYVDASVNAPTVGTTTLGATTAGTVIGFADFTPLRVGDTLPSANRALVYAVDANGLFIALATVAQG